jgi:hypothetical protein
MLKDLTLVFISSSWPEKSSCRFTSNCSSRWKQSETSGTLTRLTAFAESFYQKSPEPPTTL